MSRLGKKPITLPKGVEVKNEKSVVFVKGKAGALELALPEGFSIELEEQNLFLRMDESKLEKPMHGLYWALLRNTVVGVTDGFSQELTLIGVGFRAAVKGSSLELQVGYSKPREVLIPVGLNVKVDKSTVITITGIDKQKVGQFAAEVRAVRPPEPYKGKGIRYTKEYVRKKAGKAAKGK